MSVLKKYLSIYLSIFLEAEIVISVSPVPNNRCPRFKMMIYKPLFCNICNFNAHICLEQTNDIYFMYISTHIHAHICKDINIHIITQAKLFPIYLTQPYLRTIPSRLYICIYICM